MGGTLVPDAMGAGVVVPTLSCAFALREGLPGEDKMVAKVRFALVAALVSLALAAPGALAYNGEVDQVADVDGPRQVVCPAAVSATVTVLDRDAKPLPGIAVTWSTGAVGTTDANGEHTITFQVASSVTVTATTANGAVGSLVITCVQPGITLPRTDTALRAGSSAPIPSWVYLLLAVTGSGLLVPAARRR